MSFDSPPLVEVALAIQFADPDVEILDMAALFQQVRKEFPQHQEQPARPSMSESFDDVPTEPFRFELLDRPPAQRFWFLSPDESRLLQVQHDLLALNWRKQAEGGPYPRYAALRKDITRFVKVLEGVLKKEGKGPLHPNWCEITYVNHIDALTKRGRLPLDSVLTILQTPARSTFLNVPEDSTLAQRFIIDDEGEPVGRFHFSAAPAYRATDGAPIWVLTLTARLRVKRPVIRGALQSLDVGHSWALGAFTELTTKPMHRLWKLRRSS